MIQTNHQRIKRISNFFSNKLNSTSKQDVLKNGLKEFGLAPTDWEIVAEPNQFRIINVDCPEFQFIGLANDGSTKWESLMLTSL